MIKSLLLTASCVLGSGAGALQKNAPVFNHDQEQKINYRVFDGNNDNKIHWTINNETRYTELQPTQNLTPNVYGYYATGESNNITIGNVGNINFDLWFNGWYGMEYDQQEDAVKIYYEAIQLQILTVNQWKLWTGSYSTTQYGLQESQIATFTGNVTQAQYMNAIIYATTPDNDIINMPKNSPTGLADNWFRIFDKPSYEDSWHYCNIAVANLPCTAKNLTASLINANTSNGLASWTDQQKNSTNTTGILPIQQIEIFYVYLLQRMTVIEYNYTQDYKNNWQTYSQQKNKYNNVQNNPMFRFERPYPTDEGNLEYGPLTPPSIANYEVIDIPDLMFTVLTLPFTFISQAFNLTLFPGTNYQVNIAGLLFALFGALLIVFIVKKLKP